MAFEVKDLSGSMFNNDKKKSANHPDFNGSIRIDNKDYWLSCWKKTGRSGEWFSFAFKAKDGEAPPFRAKETSEPKQTFTRDLDDEIPF